MQRWHEQYLGFSHFPASLSSVEVEHYFTLSDAELAHVKTRRRPLNRLGVALQIGFLRMTGRLLNSFQMVPPDVLNHLGAQLHIVPPRLASIRALYRRRRTLFDHQRISMQSIGFRNLTRHAERGLTAFLRKSVETTFRPDALALEARTWLYQHCYVAPAARPINSLVRAALRHAETRLGKDIMTAVNAATLTEWREALLQRHEGGERTVLEWLREPPQGKTQKDVSNQFDKFDFLAALRLECLPLKKVSLSRLYFYARPMTRRRPAALTRLKEPRRTIELVCFLRWLQLEVTDSCINLFDHSATDLWRQAQQRARDRQLEQIDRYQRLIPDLRRLADDESITVEELRAKLSALIGPFETPDYVRNHSAVARHELSRFRGRLRALMKRAAKLPFEIAESNPLEAALNSIRSVYDKDGRVLLPGTTSPFSNIWDTLILDENPAAAMAAFEAATMLTLKRSLRNGTAALGESLSYRSAENLLVPSTVWEKERARLYRHLRVPPSLDNYVRRLRDVAQSSLYGLAKTIEEGAITIEQNRIRIPRAKPHPEDEDVGRIRRDIFELSGLIQLPDLLVEIDSQTRFSWLLLGRSPRNERELITLYGAVFALGTDLTAAEVTRMVPGLSEEAVGSMIRLIEEDQRLRRANDAIVQYLRSHEVAEAWGTGLFASSDMTSLDATRHLWNARLDPRRRSYAVGTYTHVLDQWSVIYDQPIVLNRRQAGVAIEGALRQSHVELEKLAVDTHGFTHFAMALAKLLGLDLCPRMANLSERKLLVPRGLDIPPVLEPVTERVPLGAKVKNGWDGLVRLAASVDGGWCQATYVLDRYGAAGRGDPVYECGTALGKILRTIYLCDYLGNLAFRQEMLDLLNQGESVHQLQRALHNGAITAKRGRSREQIKAISGGLALLTNAVMAWNTAQMQKFLDGTSGTYPMAAFASIAPVNFKHINMRGIFTFDLGDQRHRLIQTPVEARLKGQI
ncbi:Tn3 family transposase [Pelagibius sp. Alg239-R121]|uniref:Tn3 family transposase n=1 Tax=Pelagibius sp. Alg239-R121 TaxID=2993448 RepID=UPI0024A6F9FF|nr:Tn3 family transposase [Pelagibius sp. Alg239-R121]